MIREGNLLRIDSKEDLIESFSIDCEQNIREHCVYSLDDGSVVYSSSLKELIEKNDYPLYFVLVSTYSLSMWVPRTIDWIQEEYNKVCNQKSEFDRFMTTACPSDAHCKETTLKWTDIKDEFPKDIKTRGHGVCNLLVTYQYTPNMKRVDQAMLFDGHIYLVSHSSYQIDDKVTHWMYLPDPPED